MKEFKQSYDIVVIGAGISGLTSSALFGKMGLSTCVLEMDPRPGGYMAGFERKGYKFDSAIHWLNDCGPNGFVSKIFKIIGDDIPEALQQNHIRRFVGKDVNYLVTNQPDLLKEQWVKEFPEDKKGIVKFFRDAKRLSKSFDKHINLSRSMDTMNWLEKSIHGLKMLDFAIPFIPHIRFSGDKGVQKGLSKYFKSQKLKNVFASEPDLLSCLIPIAWAYSNNFQKPPIGGSRAYPEWLTYASQKMGIDISFSSKVNKVLVEHNTVKGVSFVKNNQQYTINCKYVVATCDLETLFEKMLPEGLIPQQKLEKLKHAELYSSAFSISLGLNCSAEELGLGEENIYLSDAKLTRDELSLGNPHTTGLHIVAPSVRDKTLTPQNKGTLTIFMPAWIENFDYWKCEKDKEGNYIRGEAYKKLKQDVADILIERVQNKLIPQLKDHIELIDIATPITHFRYTGNKNGTMMGQRPGQKNMQNKVASYTTPVNNLLSSGHWGDLGGGVPIAVKSALNTSLMILKKEDKKKFKVLAKYIDGKLSLEELRKSALFYPYDSSWKLESSKQKV